MLSAERQGRSGAAPPQRLTLPEFCGDEVGRGEGQGYFACRAGGCGFESHLVHQLRASSSMDRAPMFPGRLFPSSSFAMKVQKEKSRFLAALGMTDLERG
jgi:hypothetical protein